MKRFCLVILFVFVLGCGSSIEPQTPAEIDHVATQVESTLQAMAMVADTAISTEEPTKTPEIGTRNNPVPLGQVFNGVKDGTMYFNLTFTKVIRGQEASQMIESANPFNSPAPEGQEYLIAYGIVDYLSSEKPDEILGFSSYDFKTVSNNQVLDTPFAVVMPEPGLAFSLYPGAHSEGFIALFVFPDDPAPLISLGNMFDNSDRIFFAIN